MIFLLAQAASEYGGAEGGILGVIVRLFNTVYDVVSNSVADHPVLWGAGVCVAAWFLVRRR